MRVTSDGIKDGHWEKKFGKYGKDFVDGVSALSVPFAIHHPPENTVAFAVMLKDNDAVAVAGHPWIHWLVANLEHENVAEDESRNNPNLLQGQNSWGFNYYGGMEPPNAPHRYDLHVYALDRELDLDLGFNEQEMETAMAGHILDSYILSAMYHN